KEHERLPDGAVFKSLATKDLDVANGYASTLKLLMDRGDWGTIGRWVAGERHISDVHRLVREGDWQSLKRLHSDGLEIGREAKDFLDRVRGLRRRRTYIVRESVVRQ